MSYRELLKPPKTSIKKGLPHGSYQKLLKQPPKIHVVILLSQPAGVVGMGYNPSSGGRAVVFSVSHSSS